MKFDAIKVGDTHELKICKAGNLVIIQYLSLISMQPCLVATSEGGHTNDSRVV